MVEVEGSCPVDVVVGLDVGEKAVVVVEWERSCSVDESTVEEGLGLGLKGGLEGGAGEASSASSFLAGFGRGV